MLISSTFEDHLSELIQYSGILIPESQSDWTVDVTQCYINVISMLYQYRRNVVVNAPSSLRGNEPCCVPLLCGRECSFSGWISKDSPQRDSKPSKIKSLPPFCWMPIKCTGSVSVSPGVALIPLADTRCRFELWLFVISLQYTQYQHGVCLPCNIDRTN